MAQQSPKSSEANGCIDNETFGGQMTPTTTPYYPARRVAFSESMAELPQLRLAPRQTPDLVNITDHANELVQALADLRREFPHVRYGQFHKPQKLLPEVDPFGAYCQLMVIPSNISDATRESLCLMGGLVLATFHEQNDGPLMTAADFGACNCMNGGAGGVAVVEQSARSHAVKQTGRTLHDFEHHDANPFHYSANMHTDFTYAQNESRNDLSTTQPSFDYTPFEVNNGTAFYTFPSSVDAYTTHPATSQVFASAHSDVATPVNKLEPNLRNYKANSLMQYSKSEQTVTPLAPHLSKRNTTSTNRNLSAGDINGGNDKKRSAAIMEASTISSATKNHSSMKQEGQQKRIRRKTGGLRLKGSEGEDVLKRGHNDKDDAVVLKTIENDDY